MSGRISALDLAQTELSDATKAYFAKCEEKLGLVPNVLRAYAFDEKKLRAFTDMYNDLMLGSSGLSKLEREMIAVVVSSINHCYYCLTAHGAAVRQLSGDPSYQSPVLLADPKVLFSQKAQNGAVGRKIDAALAKWIRDSSNDRGTASLVRDANGLRITR